VKQADLLQATYSSLFVAKNTSKC